MHWPPKLTTTGPDTGRSQQDALVVRHQVSDCLRQSGRNFASRDHDPRGTGVALPHTRQNERDPAASGGHSEASHVWRELDDRRVRRHPERSPKQQVARWKDWTTFGPAASVCLEEVSAGALAGLVPRRHQSPKVHRDVAGLALVRVLFLLVVRWTFRTGRYDTCCGLQRL